MNAKTQRLTNNVKQLCKEALNIQSEVNIKTDSLNKLYKIQNEIEKAKNIEQFVDDPKDLEQIKHLALALEDEYTHQRSQKLINYSTTGISLGSTLLAMHIIKKANQNQLPLFRKTRNGVFTFRTNRVQRYGINSALVFSLASTYWAWNKSTKNYNKIKSLEKTITRLNEIRDLTEVIIETENELEQQEELLYSKSAELYKKNPALINERKIQCF